MNESLHTTEGTLYLDLITTPDRGNVVSIKVEFPPKLFPFTMVAECDFAKFTPAFNEGDIYRGSADILATFYFEDHLPTSASLTILNEKLQITFYYLPESTKTISHLNSVSSFIKIDPSSTNLPLVQSNQRMDVTWIENNVLP